MSRGCYGIAWSGIDGADRYLNDVADDAPLFAVHSRVTDVIASAEEVLEPGFARLPLSDGASTAEVRQADQTVTLALARDYDDDAVLHPFLAGAAAAINHWRGRDSFHAGAVVIDGRAWVVTGDKGDGKSTMLAYLATRGLPVLADDLIIEDDGDALAGPGFIDLRADAAAELGIGRDIGWLGARTRARFDLPARPPSAPIAGWVCLRWSDELRLRALTITERLDELYKSRTVQEEPADPASYLRHAARPFYELSRPRSWNAMAATYDLLLSSLR